MSGTPAAECKMSTTTEVGISPVLLQAISTHLSGSPGSQQMVPQQGVEVQKEAGADLQSGDVQVQQNEIVIHHDGVTRVPDRVIVQDNGMQYMHQEIVKEEQVQEVPLKKEDDKNSEENEPLHDVQEVTIREEVVVSNHDNDETVYEPSLKEEVIEEQPEIHTEFITEDVIETETVQEIPVQDDILDAQVNRSKESISEPLEQVVETTSGNEQIVLVHDNGSAQVISGQMMSSPQRQPGQIVIKRVVGPNVTNIIQSEVPKPSVQPGGEISMGNVLSAIANHLNRKRKASESIDSPQQVEIVQTEAQNPYIITVPSQDAQNSNSQKVITESSIPVTPQKAHLVSTGNATPGGYILTNNGEVIQFQTPLSQTDAVLIATQMGGQTLPPAPESCPICSDKISGYHYGVYSCESCKGFFKRTVQNKKTFVCHRRGECDVNIANRKKCPACRFNRCLNSGMKLEAIRTDRSRGGRSSYDGCTPIKKMHIQPPKPKTRPDYVPSEVPQMRDMSGDPSVADHMPSGMSNLSEDQDENSKEVMVTPQTPAVLDDLMAVESLMNDDEDEQLCCEGRLLDGDPDPFGSLLHFADHCLYKIVRWARNLPDFANVTTDDQILLLQNCWAELLCLCIGWKSVHLIGEIRLSHGRRLSVDLAKAVRLAELIQKMLDFTDNLRNLEVDHYEFVSLKSLLLISPDVKGLKENLTSQTNQERTLTALLTYTATHYPQTPNKFAEMLARLPELSRIAAIAKTQLAQRQAAGEVPAGSLLSELLKGDQLAQQQQQQQEAPEQQVEQEVIA